MKTARAPFLNDVQSVYALPRWVTSDRGGDSEAVAFSSGAALAVLDLVLRKPEAEMPAPLLRDRLALAAAAACLGLEGRRDSKAEIRDAFYLTRIGDAMGPAGTMFNHWRKVAAIGLDRADWPVGLKLCLPAEVAQELPDRRAQWRAMAGQGSPVAQAARMTGRIVAAFPRQEAAALMCGDVVLAQALGWAHPLPLMALHMRRKDVRVTGDELLRACHRSVAAGTPEVVRMAGDLARRAQHLRAIAPRLRARGADAAVALFLNEGAVFPATMLSPRIKGTAVAMSDRAARRLCDRLVELGGVRELSGRDTFRLYGVG
jgi:Protein of unknown function (DUF1403)